MSTFTLTKYLKNIFLFYGMLLLKWFEKAEVENALLYNLIIYTGILQSDHSKDNFLHISCIVQNIAVASLESTKPLVNV